MGQEELTKKTLAELQQMGKEIGLKSVSKLRKTELIEKIQSEEESDKTEENTSIKSITTYGFELENNKPCNELPSEQNNMEQKLKITEQKETKQETKRNKTRNKKNRTKRNRTGNKNDRTKRSRAGNKNDRTKRNWAGNKNSRTKGKGVTIFRQWLNWGRHTGGNGRRIWFFEGRKFFKR